MSRGLKIAALGGCIWWVQWEATTVKQFRMFMHYQLQHGWAWLRWPPKTNSTSLSGIDFGTEMMYPFRGHLNIHPGFLLTAENSMEGREVGFWMRGFFCLPFERKWGWMRYKSHWHSFYRHLSHYTPFTRCSCFCLVFSFLSCFLFRMLQNCM